MKRLKQHFQSARTCRPGGALYDLKRRSVGFEVETLFVDRSRKAPELWPGNIDLRRQPPDRYPPISRDVSQQIFKELVFRFGWKIEETKNGTVVRISHTTSTDGVGRYTHQLIYELGWNNIELITPNWYYDSVLDIGIMELEQRLRELYTAALMVNAIPLEAAYDGFENDDTLMMPDKRDEVWKELDGPVLPVLGHIASVHYNIDLVSIDEGMEWIKAIAKLREREGWPSPAASRIWQRYLVESHANYEPDRFGTTPTTDFDEYCSKLARYKVVMGRACGAPQLIANPKPFNKTPDIDVELFLRSVWWGARLRVRGGQLVLEIRDVPRGPDSEIRENFDILRGELRF